MEGWVDLGTAVKVHSPCPRLYIAAAVAINTTGRGVFRTLVLSHHSQTCQQLGSCKLHKYTAYTVSEMHKTTTWSETGIWFIAALPVTGPDSSMLPQPVDIITEYIHTPRWAGTRKVKPVCILLKQETVSSSGVSWAICKSAPHSRQITTPAPHHSVFYRPDALPATQPTASKHWR